MSTDEPFRTDYELLRGVDYIFVSLDRNLSGEECHELAEKYFETHKGMTLPGQVLRVDLRPAFRKPLADFFEIFLRCEGIGGCVDSLQCISQPTQVGIVSFRVVRRFGGDLLLFPAREFCA